MIFQITLHVKPLGKGRPRMTKKGRVYTPAETASAEAEIRWLLRKENPPKFEGPVSVIAKFFVARPKSAPKRIKFPATRPDLDNYFKTLLDALNGLLFHDDSQVIEANIAKEYGEPRIELKVMGME